MFGGCNIPKLAVPVGTAGPEALAFDGTFVFSLGPISVYYDDTVYLIDSVES
ncbi:MAG: hypothetical protein JRN15_09455 [Nitrososphaerota archaeon]|nr:hypothetical protein [Nitrososphaerota archaeon]